jgi:hypothetical protein
MPFFFHVAHLDAVVDPVALADILRRAYTSGCFALIKHLHLDKQKENKGGWKSSVVL